MIFKQKFLPYSSTFTNLNIKYITLRKTQNPINLKKLPFYQSDHATLRSFHLSKNSFPNELGFKGNSLTLLPTYCVFEPHLLQFFSKTLDYS